MAHTIGKVDVVNDRNRMSFEMYLTASTSNASFATSDIGQLVGASSNWATRLSTANSTAFTALGIFRGCREGFDETTGGSSNPIYVEPIGPDTELEMPYDSDASTTIPATTDLGKYCGFSTNADVGYLDMGTLTAAYNAGDPFKLVGFNTRNHTARVRMHQQSIAGRINITT